MFLAGAAIFLYPYLMDWHYEYQAIQVLKSFSNVVLAAHRGYRGIPMFRDIEKLKPGDIVSLTTPFDTLTYEVVETTIILPGDIDKILIQPGRDMLTLFTCHPYRQNSHRYVVYCERTYTSESGDGKSDTFNIETVDSTDNLDSSYAEVVKNSISDSEKQILLDKYVPIAGVIVLFILFLVFLVMPGKKKK